jgi:hypothetical protein
MELFRRAMAVAPQFNIFQSQLLEVAVAFQNTIGIASPLMKLSSFSVVNCLVTQLYSFDVDICSYGLLGNAKSYKLLVFEHGRSVVSSYTIQVLDNTNTFKSEGFSIAARDSMNKLATDYESAFLACISSGTVLLTQLSPRMTPNFNCLSLPVPCSQSDYTVHFMTKVGCQYSVFIRVYGSCMGDVKPSVVSVNLADTLLQLDSSTAVGRALTAVSVVLVAQSFPASTYDKYGNLRAFDADSSMQASDMNTPTTVGPDRYTTAFAGRCSMSTPTEAARTSCAALDSVAPNRRTFQLDQSKTKLVSKPDTACRTGAMFLPLLLQLLLPLLLLLACAVCGVQGETLTQRLASCGCSNGTQPGCVPAKRGPCGHPYWASYL